MTEKQLRRLFNRDLPPLHLPWAQDRPAGVLRARPGWLDRRFDRWFKATLLGLALILLAGAALVWIGGRETLIEAQVAVILGNQVYRDGRPAPRLAARLDKGLELYRSGRCQTLIVSGGKGPNRVDEAAAMADYLAERGVPRSAIVVDAQGVNTWHTAVFTADYLRRRGLDSAIVVSQAFHTPRSALALAAAGCPRVGRAAPDYWEARDIYSILRELPAIAVYWWRYEFRAPARHEA